MGPRCHLLIVYASLCLSGSVAGCYATSEDEAEKCRRNLNALGDALTSAFAPEELAACLADSSPWDAVIEKWPSDGAPIPKAWLSEMICGCPGSLARGERGPSYSVNSRLREALAAGKAHEAIPILWDKPANHGQVVCVCYLDGHAEVEAKEDWHRYVESLRTEGLAP